MKKARLIIALLALLVAASGYAQDSYRQALKEYISLNGSLQSLQQTTNLKQVNQYLFKSGNLNLDQLTDRYMEEGMIDFLMDLMIPKMKELGVTEEGLKKTASLLATPEGKTLTKHSQQWGEAMKNDLISILEKNRSKFMDGVLADPVQPKADIDAEYQVKYNKVIKDQQSKIFTQIFDNYTGMFKRIAEKTGFDKSKEMEEKMEKVKVWWNTNLPTIAMNNAYGILTPDDIDYTAKLYSGDNVYKKMLVLANTTEIESMGMGIMSNYVEWMQDHGAVLQDGILDALKSMGTMFGK